MKRLLAGAACLLVLTGCSGKLSPHDTLKDETAQLIDAANSKNPSGVHSAAASLSSTIQDQLASGKLTAGEAATLRKLLAAIEREADLLTAPSPTPTPSPTASPTASPTPSPTRSPTPSPTPSPTASPTPSPTASPTPPAPSISVGLGSPSPTVS